MCEVASKMGALIKHHHQYAACVRLAFFIAPNMTVLDRNQKHKATQIRSHRVFLVHFSTETAGENAAVLRVIRALAEDYDNSNVLTETRGLSSTVQKWVFRDDESAT